MSLENYVTAWAQFHVGDYLGRHVAPTEDWGGAGCFWSPESHVEAYRAFHGELMALIQGYQDSREVAQEVGDFQRCIQSAAEAGSQAASEVGSRMPPDLTGTIASNDLTPGQVVLREMLQSLATFVDQRHSLAVLALLAGGDACMLYFDPEIRLKFNILAKPTSQAPHAVF